MRRIINSHEAAAAGSVRSTGTQITNTPHLAKSLMTLISLKHCITLTRSEQHRGNECCNEAEHCRFIELSDFLPKAAM